MRGTTSREIVQMAREAGATKVLFVSCSPEVTHPHVHGIDLADPAELIAHGKTREEVATLIDADEVVYQSLDDLKAACFDAAGPNNDVNDFEVGVFCGKYKTEVPEGYFEHLSRVQGAKKKAKAVANVASSGPTNDSRNGLMSPEHREDIR